MLRRIVLGTTALALMVLIGCGGPPTEDINKAKAAKTAADGASAAMYVKDTYDAATASMTAGETAVKAKEWDKAKKAYMEAAKQFDAAAKAAPDAMAAMKTELMDRMAKADEGHMKMGKDKAMMAKIKMMKKEGMVKECEAAVAAAKEALAKEPADLMAAKEALDKDDAIHAELTALMTAKK